MPERVRSLSCIYIMHVSVKHSGSLEMPIFQFPHLATETLDEPAIVRDGDDRAGKARERGFKGFQHVQADVVGRLSSPARILS